ncbi:MAG TPA: hypothetical protein VNJ07_11830, partial [Chitinophagales bacterium]|nr:hypothetical protein [Chitinophagales bacterium]
MTDAAIEFRNQRKFLQHLRTDTWWLESVLVVSVLLTFIVYSSWAAWQGEYYWWSAGVEGFGGYLSPFYSPPLFIDASMPGAAPLSHAWLGEWPSWLKAIWPPFLPASPAWLILIFPLSFRFTCYYYRGAYYKAFAATPPACAVGGIPQKPYKGETGLLIFQNLHRFALYFAIIFIFILSYDAVLSFFRGGQFGVGVGSIVLLLNPIFLGAYTFGCHSYRHLIGGGHDCFNCQGGLNKIRYTGYKRVTWLNERHKFFAWLSL